MMSHDEKQRDVVAFAMLRVLLFDVDARDDADELRTYDPYVADTDADAILKNTVMMLLCLAWSCACSSPRRSQPQ